MNDYFLCLSLSPVTRLNLPLPNFLFKTGIGSVGDEWMMRVILMQCPQANPNRYDEILSTLREHFRSFVDHKYADVDPLK